MNVPPVAVGTTAQNVVVKVPSQILKINKFTLIGFGVGVVVTGAATFGVTKFRNRNKVTVELPGSVASV